MKNTINLSHDLPYLLVLVIHVYEPSNVRYFYIIITHVLQFVFKCLCVFHTKQRNF